LTSRREEGVGRPNGVLEPGRKGGERGYKFDYLKKETSKKKEEKVEESRRQVQLRRVREE